MLVLGAVAAFGLAVAGGVAWMNYASPEIEAASDDDLPVPPVPPRIAEGDEYDKCLSMLQSDPSGAYTFADTWQAAGGGDGAIHCRALAEIELGDPEEGATLLDQLGANSPAAPAARAAILGQASQAWMMAGTPQHANVSATKALALVPDDPDLLIERAIANSSLEHYTGADDDLTRALDIDPKRGDALVLRAAARRHLERLDLASNDVERALELDPEDPDAFLERGIVRQRRGNPAGARKDWERAIELSPDSATGDLAQQNLALLEAGPERR
ncbi:MAG: tetratricopeptide repeat protein [Pseudomonadota bacterium]|nr:tetratricopeptide repeat protein [Pseudomonadota bacterium]